MKFWCVSIPIKDPVLEVLPTLRCSDIWFHIYDDLDLRRKQLFGSVILEEQEISAAWDKNRSSIGKVEVKYGNVIVAQPVEILTYKYHRHRMTKIAYAYKFLNKETY